MERQLRYEEILETKVKREMERDGEHTSNCVTAPYFSSPEGEKYLLL